MKLVGFQVFNYRNIIDSKWVDVDRMAAIVGQNECGKSNLLRALDKFNSFDSSNKFDLARDWPVDKWGEQNEDEWVCKVRFELTEEEIQELFTHAAVEPEQEESDDDEEDGGEENAEPSEAPPLPESLSAVVWKSYGNKFGTEFDEELPDGIDIGKARGWVVSHLPKCVYMSDYATFAGHMDLEHLAARLKNPGFDKVDEDEKTVTMVLRLAALDINDIVKKGTTEEGRTSRGFDTNAASLLLSRKFKKKWKQKDVKFNIRVDGTTLDVHVEDLGLEAFVPLEARSRGFQWFVSFIWRFTYATDGEYADTILLLDEPGVHLHHAGHKDLLEFFEELAKTNTLLYTTHLSTMLDEGYPERIRLMEIRDHHAHVLNRMVGTQKQPMMVVEARLGLAGRMSGLLGSRQNLVVEGEQDAIILHKLSGVLQKSGEEGLSDRIYIIPAQGASKTPMYASFFVGHEWDSAVLLDSDEEGNKARDKIKGLKGLAEASPGKFRILMLGDATKSKSTDFEIEDIFPVTFYLECANEAYGTNITETDLPVDGTARVAKRFEAVLKDRGRAKELDKERVMLAMLKRFSGMKTKGDLPTGTHKKARALIDKINEVFAEAPAEAK